MRVTPLLLYCEYLGVPTGKLTRYKEYFIYGSNDHGHESCLFDFCDGNDCRDRGTRDVQKQ